ncbi:MAG: nif11-class peptide radical SAM maturase 3 [Candidatus Eremiobacterota bacterium]
MATRQAYRRTTYAVWEITLKCNLACCHCGSRAGEARSRELDTKEALDLVRQLAEAGIGEVSLIGGEAFLRPDWLDLARAIVDRGMVCTMTTGGFGISRNTARRMRQAGIARVSVSVDGQEATHDRLRGRDGSWRFCFETMRHFREEGLPFGCNTQINRLSAPEIPGLYERIRDAGATAWQIQLTVPMGNAADNHEILMQPAELLDLYPMLARVTERANSEGVRVLPGNNIGYYGPYERLLRSGGGARNQIWMGCQAGLYTLGIEADGAIKGCPSLPTSAYTGGNIRERSLDDIVRNTPELTLNLGGGTPEGVRHLWGFCSTCDYSDLCRGGCSWTAHVFFDRRGNNPYCHHRALEQARRGRRERLVPLSKAGGLPFDNGVFELIEEPLEAPWPQPDRLHFTADRVVWPPGW